LEHRELIKDWEQKGLLSEVGDYRVEWGGPLRAALGFALLAFPAMAIGLSGFELTMASAPMVAGSASDNPAHPRGRISRTRLLMLAAAIIMCVLVLSSIFVVTLFVPSTAIGPADNAEHRALAYLAHGQPLKGGIPPGDVVPISGSAFGTLYDISTVLILCLAGASATISLKDIVPEFLSRFGMQMVWAHRIGVIMHLFNVLILLVTIAFQASVSALQWAYAASVLALLFGASLAATLDVRQRLRRLSLRWLASLPFTLITVLFGLMGVLIVVQRWNGVAIALGFVAVVLVTAIVSRWLRSTELRFEGFAFADEQAEKRWNEICKLEFQVLVPHDPSADSLRHKEEEIRQRHRLGSHVPIIFIEVRLGDTSDFFQKPLMSIGKENDEEVICVSHCTSIAHVLAAIGLAFREVGEPPELHFAWSDESPMAANLHFLLLGTGNVPWMVHALLRKAEPNPARRPRVIVG
jgi:hypothetical protein